MKPKRAEKKNFLSKIQSVQLVLESLNDMIDRLYNDLFRVYRMSSTQVATEYLAGLLKCEKGHENMERMVEKVDNSDPALRDMALKVAAADADLQSASL